MNLVLLGMQQNRAAFAASIIHGLSLALSTGGAFNAIPFAGALTSLRLIFGSVILAPCLRREHYRTLSHRRPESVCASDGRLCA